MTSDPSLDAVSKSAEATPTLSHSFPRNIPTNYHSHLSSSNISNRSNADERPRSPDSSGEEQALEWHEVIELQEFSKRKAWIEDKTKVGSLYSLKFALLSTSITAPAPGNNASSTGFCGTGRRTRVRRGGAWFADA
jgi:hypothetical protein